MYVYNINIHELYYIKSKLRYVCKCIIHYIISRRVCCWYIFLIIYNPYCMYKFKQYKNITSMGYDVSNTTHGNIVNVYYHYYYKIITLLRNNLRTTSFL